MLGLGRSKEAVIRHLLEKAMPAAFSHIRSLKDIQVSWRGTLAATPLAVGLLARTDTFAGQCQRTTRGGPWQ